MKFKDTIKINYEDFASSILEHFNEKHCLSDCEEALKYNFKTRYSDEVLKKLLPIIYSVYKNQGKKKIFYDFETEGNKKQSVESDCDPRYLFLDSCIWFRYNNLNDTAGYIALIEELKNNFQLDLYTLKSAHEFRDFQIRLFRNSYVKKIGKSAIISHAGLVNPFAFHSESKMETLLRNLLSDSENFKDGDKWEWDILLFDDHAVKKLTNIEGKESSISKGELIKRVLDVKPYEDSHISEIDKCVYSFSDRGITFTFNFHKIQKYDLAQKHLIEFIKGDSSKFYDIILMDYLFNEDNLGTKIGRFSDEIIKLLHNEFNEDKNNGIINNFVLGKLWIFPISVYQKVITDKLRNAGIPYYGGNFIFSEGADPVCTPHLFRYKFFKFLELQIEEIQYSKSKSSLSAILDLGKKITLEDSLEKRIIELRGWAKKSFPSIVELGVNFERLHQHKDKSSFANSAIRNLFFDLKRKQDWIYLQNFFDILSFTDYPFPDLLRKNIEHFENYNPDLYKILSSIVNNALTSNEIT